MRRRVPRRVQRPRRGKFLRVECSLMTTPYFKRVLEDMQSGYQPEQTAFHSIHLRPRTNASKLMGVLGPPGVRQSDTLFNDTEFDDTLIFGITNPNSIITRLRIWVRKAMKRRMQFSQDYNSHLGGFARNLVSRGGWQVNASLRNPHYFGQAIEQFRPHPGTAVRGYDPKLTWTKNQRARLF